MQALDELVENYHEGHSGIVTVLTHVAGILAANLGILSLLWSLPHDLVNSWLGDHPFANWATIYAVLMIIYYGSQSFSLTFAGGIFYQGCLYVVWNAVELGILPAHLMGLLLGLLGLLIMLAGHIIQGNSRAILKDIKYLPISITWIFRFIYRWLGVSF